MIRKLSAIVLLGMAVSAYAQPEIRSMRLFCDDLSVVVKSIEKELGHKPKIMGTSMHTKDAGMVMFTSNDGSEYSIVYVFPQTNRACLADSGKMKPYVEVRVNPEKNEKGI